MAAFAASCTSGSILPASSVFHIGLPCFSDNDDLGIGSAMEGGEDDEQGAIAEAIENELPDG